MHAALIALSIIVSTAAIVLWVRNFDVSGPAVEAMIGRLRWWALVPLFALLSFHVALASWRWSIIDSALGGSAGIPGQAFNFGAIAMAFGTFLPPPLVYVACRGLANRMNGASPIRGAVSGAIDQGADFLVVLMMAIPSAMALLGGSLLSFLAGAAMMAVVGLVGALGVPRSAMIGTLLVKAGLGGFHDGQTLLRIYGLSLLRVVNLIAITLLISLACGAGSAEAIIVGVPLVTLAISIAMLPGALGVSEWSFTAVFAAFGLPASETVTFVLANRLLLTSLALLLGGIACVAMAMRFRSRQRITA